MRLPNRHSLLWQLVGVLELLCMLVIVARHGGHLVKTFKHTEPKLSTKKDLSYKFDEDF